MRQAIEEEFILDVLENYTTYKAYWNILKKVEDDPRYDRKKAAYLLRQFVDLHEHTIAQKVAIIVEHFHDHVAHQIDGRAKAMIVTRSRLHAVRYRLALDRRLEERGVPYRALVAFSGTVKDPDTGQQFTESGMNGFPDSRTAAAFEEDGNRFLVVANKFQTGFDQPLLHTMYVDRRLSGVHAVQTLSRLNRVHPKKRATMVLDFANEAEDIQQAFEPYYDKTMLAEGTDPNLLYDLEHRLEQFHLYGPEEVEQFARAYFGGKGQDALYRVLRPVVQRYGEIDDEERRDFRSALADFVRKFAFLSQVIRFVDADLEKLYHFARYLHRLLPRDGQRLPREVLGDVELESYRLQLTHEGEINLEEGRGELPQIGERPPPSAVEPEKEPLSEIIRLLNERFGTDFSEKDRVTLENLERALHEDERLARSVRVNTPENARLTFEQVVEEHFQHTADSNFQFYKQVTDNPRFAEFLLEALFRRCMEGVGR